MEEPGARQEEGPEQTEEKLRSRERRSNPEGSAPTAFQGPRHSTPSWTDFRWAELQENRLGLAGWA